MTTTPHVSNLIREEALKIGFLDCGFSKSRPLIEQAQAYNDWLKNGHNAGIEYMARNIEQRFNPALLVENAQTVISLLFNYYTPETLTGSPLKIAKYAYGEDYHDVVKEKLRALGKFILSLNPEATMRSFVDSAPVLERTWAQNAGLGWIGKNSCLISRKHGSFFFIAEIITSIEIADSQPIVDDTCGTCQKCIEACPTAAITANRTIDCNQCISYQTIENRGEIPSRLKGKFENNIFGCDICQDVCPWNKKSTPHSELSFQLKDDIKLMSANDWSTFTEETYLRVFRKSAVKRTKFSGLKRNINFVHLP